MNRSDQIITRLERAGGAVSEAVQLANEANPPLANLFASVNIAISDCRRAVVRIQNSDDADQVRRDLERTLREAFE